MMVQRGLETAWGHVRLVRFVDRTHVRLNTLVHPESTRSMSAEDTLFQRFGKEFPKSTVLFREGEAGKEMYVLQSGKVVITKKVRDTEKTLAVLGPGEFFGEMALISNKPRNATATVAEAARLLVIDPKTFEGMIRGNSEIAVRMIKKLAERLSEADAQIENPLVGRPREPRGAPPAATPVRRAVARSRRAWRLTFSSRSSRGSPGSENPG